MNMDEKNENNQELPKGDLEDQLNSAKQEIESLTQQLNCLLVLTKNAWRGDEAATVHLARVIGIDPDIEQNNFVEKKVTRYPSAKKSVKIIDNEEVISKHTPSIASSISQDNLLESSQQTGQIHASVRNTYLQPFLKQSHIDPIRGQSSNQIFHNMVRHHQTEMRKSPVIATRSSPSSVRPRVTKHLYRPASAEHVVRHLGSPFSRTRPYFVFAGKEFFQRTTDYSPLYQRAVMTSQNGSRQSEHSDISDESDLMPAPANEPIIARPQTAKSTHQSSTLRFSARSSANNNPPRISSAISTISATKLKPVTERERRDAMRLQRQLGIPRQGWLNHNS